MEITNNNPYTRVNTNQREATTPGFPSQNPVTIPEYQKPELKPGQIDDIKEAFGDKAEEINQKKDNARSFMALNAGVQSKKEQFDIYMSGMTGTDIDTGNDTKNLLESIDNVYKQNQTLKAMAAYSEYAL
jgi:hypothetical protein